jgi:hypothetical protein
MPGGWRRAACEKARFVSQEGNAKTTGQRDQENLRGVKFDVRGFVIRR